ncbi:MAG: helix-turn-helix domain-containing protein [Thermoleophilia bacterium]|nr:helix-turn-helix domain-containing protein [Thermoleophilia bacterium]
MTSDDLVGLSEVAQLLGVTRRTVQRYAERADFPAPKVRVAAGRLWRRTDVETWAREHLPLPTGRPRNPKPDAAR